MELDTDDAVIRLDGERLIIEAITRRADLATLLIGWKPLDETLPDIDEGLPPLDDIAL
ncbi:AbrB/MazE/SpoVT family DNA-binding domain-containing protein [Thiocystis violacea]|uniref:AbrB/MazE/SpoVT family DNA-binding domain-containing protein n=1 Tax=Thiocystis violacea TaxID=13725 RepID=UPI0031F744EB